jgi:hypothetical protein
LGSLLWVDVETSGEIPVCLAVDPLGYLLAAHVKFNMNLK